MNVAPRDERVLKWLEFVDSSRPLKSPYAAPPTMTKMTPASPRKPARRSRQDHPSSNSSTSIDLGPINLALGQTVDGEGEPSITASDGAFPAFLFGAADAASSPFATAQMNMQRQPPAQMSQQQHANANATNGVGPAVNGMAGMPISPGQQMDVNMVYQKLMELSEVLKENRERTQGIVAGAEELAVSTTTISV